MSIEAPPTGTATGDELPDASPTAADLKAQIQREIRLEMARLRQERQEIFRPESRLWAAVAPGWTARLAADCDFPGADKEGAEPLLEHMAAAGLLQIYPINPASSQDEPLDYYVMPPNRRAEVLQDFLSEKTSSEDSIKTKFKEKLGAATSREDELLHQVARIGRRVLEASPDERLVEVRRWARLAAYADRSERMVAEFNQQIEPALASQDLSAIRDWIETARPLAALLEHNNDKLMNIAIEQAGRQIELIKRRENDLRHLTSFLRRDEQIEVVKRLLTGPDEQWALHFIGAGGVGKTMIIRYINCLVNSQPGDPCFEEEVVFEKDFATARVDFDYLNPDYPFLDPGLLLWSLAEELRPYASRAGLESFDKAKDLFDEVHKALKSEGYRYESPTQHPLFISALTQYIAALQHLDRRILLILDTCEELAKSSPEGTPNRNVDETFRILRALHDGPATLHDENVRPSGGLPSLRVILSGRRLLGGNGAGWRSPGSPLPPRPFLRLHEIRGFPLPEAAAFLEREHVPPGLVAAAIDSSSPDAASMLQIDWDDEADRPADVERCNPYRLHLFKSWTLEEMPPTAEELRQAAAGGYVELRILQRLNDDELKRHLPVVAMLGHFDQPLFQAATSLDQDASARLFDALLEQEWTGAHRGAVGQGEELRLIVDVHKDMRDALSLHFKAEGLPAPSARRRAAEYIKHFILDAGNLHHLEWTDFDAALYTLETDPVEAVDWWAQVEAHLRRERDPDWRLKIYESLTGRDGAARLRDPLAGPDVPPENRLRPMVLASMASAYLHKGEFSRLAELWLECTQKAASLPGSAAIDRFRRRALAGQIAATRFHQEAWAFDLTGQTLTPVGEFRLLRSLLDSFWAGWIADPGTTFFDPQEAAAAVAACEALVEQAETLIRIHPGFAPDLLAAGEILGPAALDEKIKAALPLWQEAYPELSVDLGELAAFACSLAGRALLLVGAPRRALAALQRSLELIQSRPTEVRSAIQKDRRAPWADWLPPENLPCRLRLEFGRLAYPALLSASETLRALGDWDLPGPPGGIDEDRLASFMLSLRLADETPTPASLGQAGWSIITEAEKFIAEKDIPGWVAVCDAHREIPPLFVVACEAYAASGQVTRALQALRTASSQEKRFDMETLRHVDRALVRLVRKMRLFEAGESAGDKLAGSQDIDDRCDALAVEWGLRRVTASFPDIGDINDAHAAWRALSVPGTLDRETCVRAAKALTSYPASAASAGDYDFTQASLHLDLLELQRLAKAAGVDLPDQAKLLVERPFDPAQWATRHATQPAEALRLLLRGQGLAVEFGESETVKSLSQRLGLRRAAWIALDEAEMRGLRLPAHALVLLAQAGAWFSRARDHLGVLCAQTTLVMLLFSELRSDDTFADERARLVMAQIGPARNAYLALRQNLAEQGIAIDASSMKDSQAAGSRQVEAEAALPGWDDLDRLAAASSLDGLKGLQPAAWQPRLVRLVACLVCQKMLKGEMPAKALAPIEDWLAEQRIGFRSGAAVEYPNEWRGFFTKPLHLADHEAAANVDLGDSPDITLYVRKRSSGLVHRLRNFWRTAAPQIGVFILAFVLTLVVSGIIGVLTYYLYLQNPLLGRLSAISTWIVAILIWILFFWARLRRIAIEIAPATDAQLKAAPSLRGSLHFRITHWKPRLARKWPPYILQTSWQDFQSGMAEGVAPPPAAARSPTQAPYDLPVDLVKSLKKILRWFPRAMPPIRLHLADGLHQHGWEATFAKAWTGETTKRPSRVPISVERRAFFAVVPARLQLDKQVEITSLASSEAASTVAQRAWSTLRGKKKYKWQLARRLPAVEKGQEAQVLHLFGSVEETSYGLRFRLQRQRYYETQIETRDERTQDTIGSADLRRLFPKLALCILQGEPAEIPSSAVRYEADLMRAFAGEVARNGAAVIVIPPLEPALAANVLKRLVRALPGFLEKSSRSFYWALAATRDDIWRAQGKQQVNWEQAQDICLYTLPEEGEK